MVGLNREDVSGQSTDHTMPPYVMLLCVLDSTVTRWRRVADWPSIGAFQMVSSDCPCDDNRAVSWCELLSRALVRLVFVGDIV